MIKIRVPIMGIIARILIFAGLVAGTAILLRPVQLAIQDQMENIRDDLIGRAEEFCGHKIRYGSMGPSLFGVLDIRNIQVLRKDDSVLLGISRLRLSYSLAEILRGNVFDAFSSVRIDRPVLNFDFKKDADLGKRFSSGRQDERNGKWSIKEMVPEKFSFRVYDGEWALSDPYGSLKLHGIGIDVSVRQNRINLDCRWSADASMTGEKGFEKLFSFLDLSPSPLFKAVMTGRLSGDFSDDFKNGRATVAIPSLSGGEPRIDDEMPASSAAGSGDYFRFKPFAINVSLSEEALEIRKAGDKSGADFSLVYDLQASRLRGILEAENFSPETLLTFFGPWKEYNPVLSFRISGNALFVLEDSGALDYAVNFSGAMPVPSAESRQGTDRRSAGSPLSSLTVEASGDSNRLSVGNLLVDSSLGVLSFRGGIDFNQYEYNPVAPYGHLSLSNFSLRKAGGISGDFFINTNDRVISLVGKNFTAGSVVLSGLDASLYREEQGLFFTASLERSNKTRTSAFSVDCSVDFEPENMRLSFMLDSFSVGDILGIIEPLAPVPDIPSFLRSAADDLLVTTELFFNTNFQQILYNAPQIVAAYEGFGEILVAASISGTDRRFELSSGTVSWNKGNAEVTGSVDFSDPDDISFFLNAAYRDLNYLFEGMVIDRHNVSIIGSYGLQFYISRETNGAYSGFVRGNNIPVPSGDSFANLNLLSSLFYYSSSSWQVLVDKVEISGITTPASSSAVLRFSGTVNENGMTIPNLFFDDGRGALGGDMSFSWDSTYQFCTFMAEIYGNNRNEYYGINGVYSNKKLELNLSGAGMQFSRISRRNAVADGKIRLTWESIRSFEAEIALPSFVLYDSDGEIKASVEANINNDNFFARQLVINYSGLELSFPFFRLSRADSMAETRAFIRGNFSGMPVDLSARGKVSFNAVDTWFDLFSDFNSLDGSIVVDTARYNTMQASESFRFTISSTREKEEFVLNINGGPENMLRFRYASGTDRDGMGNFYAALSAPSPVRGSVSGSIGLTTIDARTTDLYVDLAALWKFVPPSVNGIMFPAGIVTASIRVAGSLDDPEFFGTALGTSVQIHVPAFLSQPVRPVPTAFVLSGTEMTFGPVDAMVGQGRGKGSGWFRFEQWIPSTLIIDVQVPDETPIPYAFDVSGVIAHGLASGKLTVSMENWVLSINGDLTAHNTEISLNPGEIAVSESAQAADNNESGITTITDFSIKSGRRVEFFWPSVNLPILQANADMGTGLRFTSDSESNRFTLTGDVKLRSGELFYLERNFYVREGTLFLRENETQVDPRISARAEIRDRTATGPVTISMIIDNARLMSFSPMIEMGESFSRPSARFVSNPPLSQMEIYSLLGQNPQGGAEGAQRNVAASAVLDSLAQFTLIRRVQRQVRDLLRLDMFSMRTQVIQNMVLRATGTEPEPDDPTVDGVYRVGNYFDNSTVFIGKYITADLFGEAMLSFRYDENKQSLGGLKLEPEIGLEMRNPIFDIRFNMIPLHRENWFIDDISFSLIWRRSF